jgi:hypothetical protein
MKTESYLSSDAASALKCPHRDAGCRFMCPPRWDGSDANCVFRRMYDAYYDPRTVDVSRLVEAGRYEDVRCVLAALKEAKT